MEHDISNISTYDMIIEILIRIFTLAAGKLPLNICKVFTAAFIAGFFFFVACLEGPYTARAGIGTLVCFIAAAFFGSVAWMIEDMSEDCEEDEL